MDDDALTRRAFAAYFRTGGLDQPSSAGSAVVQHDGKYYVMLHNAAGLMAVYRVRNDGVLKRLVRWPAALDG